MANYIDSKDIVSIHMHEAPYDREIFVYTSPFCVRNSQSFAFGMTRIPPHHVHEVHSHSSEEVLYVLSGQGKAECGNLKFKINKGMIIQCLANESHGFINTEDEDLELLWIASPPGREKQFLPEKEAHD